MHIPDDTVMFTGIIALSFVVATVMSIIYDKEVDRIIKEEK